MWTRSEYLRQNRGRDFNMMPDQDPRSIDFVFARSPYFRTIRANGIWGVPTATGELSIIFYSERLAMPERLTYQLSEEGITEDPPIIHGEPFIHRECEVEAVMNIDEARRIHAWLGEKLEELSAFHEDADKQSEDNDNQA